MPARVERILQLTTEHVSQWYPTKTVSLDRQTKGLGLHSLFSFFNSPASFIPAGYLTNSLASSYWFGPLFLPPALFSFLTSSPQLIVSFFLFPGSFFLYVISQAVYLLGPCSNPVSSNYSSLHWFPLVPFSYIHLSKIYSPILIIAITMKSWAHSIRNECKILTKWALFFFIICILSPRISGFCRKQKLRTLSMCQLVPGFKVRKEHFWHEC